MSVEHPVVETRAEVLDRLVELAVGLWSYGWDDATVRHLGPMAQDFATAFGLGDTDKQIFLLDATGSVWPRSKPVGAGKSIADVFAV